MNAAAGVQISIYLWLHANLAKLRKE